MQDRMGWGAAGFNQPDPDREIVLDEIHITGDGPDAPAENKILPLLLGVAVVGAVLLIFRRRA